MNHTQEDNFLRSTTPFSTPQLTTYHTHRLNRVHPPRAHGSSASPEQQHKERRGRGVKEKWQVRKILCPRTFHVNYCHSSAIAFIARGTLEKVINSSIIPNRPLDKSHWHLHLSTMARSRTNGWLIYRQFPVLKSLTFRSSVSWERILFNSLFATTEILFIA